MYNLLRNTYRRVLRLLPDRLAVYLIFFKGYHRILNLRVPQYFGEKIQWLKLYGGLEELSAYVDKYEVRKYVKETVGEQYLNELYGVFDSEEDVDFGALPNQFVLKCTNGSGQTLVCLDKSKLNIASARRQMRRWLDDDFYKLEKEPQYKNVKNRIIAEKYLEGDSGILRDYKLYSFNGEPLYFGVFTHEANSVIAEIFDMDGRKREGKVCPEDADKIRPVQNHMSELVEITRKLAQRFTFVRVDYYICEDKIIFGELTFTDGAGSEPFKPMSLDLEVADRIPLRRVLQQTDS